MKVVGDIGDEEQKELLTIRANDESQFGGMNLGKAAERDILEEFE